MDIRHISFLSITLIDRLTVYSFLSNRDMKFHVLTIVFSLYYLALHLQNYLILGNFIVTCAREIKIVKYSILHKREYAISHFFAVTRAIDFSSSDDLYRDPIFQLESNYFTFDRLMALSAFKIKSTSYNLVSWYFD